MNGVFWIVITFVGQLLTSAVTVKHIYEQRFQEQVDLRKTQFPNVPESPKIRRELSFLSMSDLKEAFNHYSKYVFLDIIFEFLKTITVFLARLYIYSGTDIRSMKK